MPAATYASKKKKKAKVINVPKGNIYIHASYNNTIVSATDPEGNVLAWASSGGSGFKGAKKATPYAATIVVKNLADKLKNFGMKEVATYVSGVGGGRESAVRALNANGFVVSFIKDTTPVAHNGPRPRRPRRV